jgi:hypothetical protein
MNPIPDRSFLRELKSIDRRLGTKFNGSHFVVTFSRGYGEPVNIALVKSETGGFRYPDKRDLEYVKSGDLAQGDTMHNRLNKMAYTSELIRRQAREKARENIRDMTKDDRIYLDQKFRQLTNMGKANSAFRRIEPKPSKHNVMSV